MSQHKILEESDLRHNGLQGWCSGLEPAIHTAPGSRGINVSFNSVYFNDHLTKSDQGNGTTH